MKNKNYSLTRSEFGSRRSFSIQYNKIVKEILIDCAISLRSDGERIPVKTIWDTGSGGGLVSLDFANKLGLKSHRKVGHYYKGAMFDKNCYLVYLHLPNDIIIPIELMEANLPADYIVIGMDIIARGNFSLENKDSKTIVSFEMPCIERVDASEIGMTFEIEEPQLINIDPLLNSIRLDYGDIVRALFYQCKISTPETGSKLLAVLADWDTGAGLSMISKSLAAKLNVKITGRSLFRSVNKAQRLDMCLVNVHLFEGNEIPVLVAIQDEDERGDLIIGMDIIGLGKFLIKSIGDETSLEFVLLK